MADFDEKTVEEEVVMLGGMIDDLDNSINTAYESKHKLMSIRAALAGAIGMSLPAEDKNQLDLTLVMDGEEVDVVKEEQ
jgi:hypothetical protein|tara:strand:- start:1308 stop:1544 length:237 start_codon:yes stop_codon:yes gene_type:complete